MSKADWKSACSKAPGQALGEICVMYHPSSQGPWCHDEIMSTGTPAILTTWQVDPQGGVTYQDEMVERDGKPEEQGQSWQEAGS